MHVCACEIINKVLAASQTPETYVCVCVCSGYSIKLEVRFQSLSVSFPLLLNIFALNLLCCNNTENISTAFESITTVQPDNTAYE